MKLEVATPTAPTIAPRPQIEERPGPEADSGDPEREGDVPWHVVLLDDDAHTYEYVIEMLGKIFGHPIRKAFRMALEVDIRKRVIVWTGHIERAEAYQEAIHNYGADWRMDISKGSMSAVLERAR